MRWRSANSATGTIVTASPPYVGRFAPSPTGPLHFGSLLAAVASYLEAQRHAGRWLLRIDDIDPPREQAGAADRILAALERYGFEWHGHAVFQRNSEAAHAAALRRLLDAGLAYPCGCSRSDLADTPGGPLGPVYPGTCRNGCDAAETAIRVRTTDEPVGFEDVLQGYQGQRLETESGDFVIWRRDGLVAYHLAVVVDDALAGVTDIVRGVDLMDSSPRQIWLQRQLGYATPRYAHIPVALNRHGQKLSKSTGAGGISLRAPQAALVRALTALRQSPPADLAAGSIGDVWNWARANWEIGRLQGILHVSAEDGAMAPEQNGLR